jgi:hypothetical protein
LATCTGIGVSSEALNIRSTGRADAFPPNLLVISANYRMQVQKSGPDPGEHQVFPANSRLPLLKNNGKKS